MRIYVNGSLSWQVVLDSSSEEKMIAKNRWCGLLTLRPVMNGVAAKWLSSTVVIKNLQTCDKDKVMRCCGGNQKSERSAGFCRHTYVNSDSERKV